MSGFLIPLLRGAAREDDSADESRAESVCIMGVGCGTSGVCFAEKMGDPGMCGKDNRTDGDEDSNYDESEYCECGSMGFWGGNELIFNRCDACGGIINEPL